MNPIAAKKVDGTVEQVSVREFSVKQFPEAFEAYYSGNELRLVEMACSAPAGWASTLSPGSYTEIASALPAINPDFFGYSGRMTAGRAIREAAGGVVRAGVQRGLSS